MFMHWLGTYTGLFSRDEFITIVVVSLVAAGFLLIGLDGLRRRCKTEHSLKIAINRNFEKKPVTAAIHRNVLFPRRITLLNIFVTVDCKRQDQRRIDKNNKLNY